MKQYNLSKAVYKGRQLSKIYAELLKLREIISKIQRTGCGGDKQNVQAAAWTSHRRSCQVCSQLPRRACNGDV